MADDSNGINRTVCWDTPSKTEKYEHDGYSIQVGMIIIPVEMMQCNKIEDWFGLSKQTDRVLEMHYGKEFRIEFN